MKLASFAVTMLFGGFALAAVVGCGTSSTPEEPPKPPPTTPAPPAPPRPVAQVDSRPPPMHQPVDKWEGGEVSGKVDAADAADEGHVLLDLGEEWTPYIFTEQDSPDTERFPHAYRPTYLALARGEFPDDHHGERAQRDKYLELYGILPTLSVLRQRMRDTMARTCAEELDLAPIEAFEGFVAYRNNQAARKKARAFSALRAQVRDWLAEQEVDDVANLDPSRLSERERRKLTEYQEGVAEDSAIRATQARLACEGYFEGKGMHTAGALDWVTHEALAEFERRNRVYGWGYIGRDTLAPLRRDALENDREAVIRGLTERAMQAAGVIEDGSSPPVRGEPPTYLGNDGARHPIPNLEEQLRERVVDAFGLETPQSTLAFLDKLEELPAHHMVAIQGVDLPEYYDRDMKLSISIDRGDVWYEFPYDENGRERAQRVQRRPRLSVIAQHNGEPVTLARFGTTIGGWRSEYVEGTVMWKYKNSPVGPRLWHQIVSAPVWLPPEGTPASAMLTRRAGGRGRDAYQINYHEMGPSYASAYGLVAAYHRLYRKEEDGSYTIRGDEGIRTHGSVDYMSIMRRHSHGCHRLHNHLAVRLMSFVLAHRPHQRTGHQRVGFGRTLEHKGHSYRFDLTQGGYVFDLEEPVHVTVQEGRIRGAATRPIVEPLPKYDADAGAYVTAEGAHLAIDRFGNTTVLRQAPPPDGGTLDGGVDGEARDGGVPVGGSSKDAGASSAAPLDPSIRLPLPAPPPPAAAPTPPATP